MTRRLAFFALAAALTLWTPSAGGSAVRSGLRLLAPTENARVHSPDLLLVYTAPPGTPVAHRLDGAAVDLPGTVVPGNDEDLHHVRLELTEGTHQVAAVDSRDESELVSISVTYVPPYSLRTAALSGAKPYAFHERSREATCSGCHSLPEVFETVADRPFSPAGKVCGACHSRIEASSSLHGPVAVYACFMCHEPEYRPTRFAQKTSQAGLCSTCHESFLAKILGGRKFVHGPVAAGACLVCHDPHGAAAPNLVRLEASQQCLACHADTLPLPVERSLHGKLGCSQCHNPHGGQTPVFTDKEGNAFCGGCHPDVAKLTSGHPIAGHPVAAEADPSRPGKAMGCTSCHDAHSLRDVSQANILENEVAQKKFCRRCHY